MSTGPIPSAGNAATAGATPDCIRFATLGPSGTNHELVLQRYMAFHGVTDYAVTLVLSFTEAVAALQAGEVDFILQCAVHPQTPATLGENFRHLFAIDSFIADSQELAVLTRAEVEVPRSIGLLMPANEKYTDLSRWEQKVSYPSLPLIFDDLLAGKIDSGLVYRSLADRFPGRMRVEEVIGSPDDVWIVYGRQRALHGPLIASADSAFAREVRARRTSAVPAA
jgi:ABC-type amino acid transport substrate-binding protein